MVNQIIFTGCGGGRILVSSQLKSTGGFAVRLGGVQILIDPGPGTLANTRRCGIDATATDIIFCSHKHIDHVNDLNAMIDAMTLGGINKKGVLICSPEVVEGEEDNAPWLMPFYKKLLNNIFIVKKGDNIKFDSITFHAVETKHDDSSAVGLVIEAPGIKIGYTSDTIYFPKLAEQFEGCDVLIANVLRPGNDAWKTHMCSEDAMRLATKAKPKLLVLHHFGAKMLQARPMYEAREIQTRTGIRTMASDDGMKIELSGLTRSYLNV